MRGRGHGRLCNASASAGEVAARTWLSARLTCCHGHPEDSWVRYGIFSDVHGNLEALGAVLEHLRTQEIDEYVFLGDAVGYGANPNEVCDLIRPLVSVGIVGNHDAAVAGRMDYHEYYDA